MTKKTVDAVKIVERVLPHDLDAERCVLGAILARNAVFDALGSLSGRQFYRDAHRRIFEAIRTLIDSRSPVDFVTLKHELTRTGHLEDCGGPSYLASLVDGVPASINAAQYASIVREKSTLRELIYAGNKILVNAYEGETPAAEQIAHADRAILDLQSQRPGGLVDIRGSVTQLFADIEYLQDHRGELRGLDTGFTSINDVLGGWMRADLVVVAARPSIGKSVFVLNTGVAAAVSGKRVALFSLEMRRKPLEFRMLSALSGIELTRLKGGYLAQADYAKLTHGMETVRNLPLFIDDRGGLTVGDIRRECRRQRADGGLDLVLIDYVQLIPGSLDRRGANRNDEMTDISRRLKALAAELDVPILLVSQLSRAGKDRQDKRPQLTDLRESGALEQDADIVAFLHRKDHRESGVTQFIIGKQRDGPTGTVNLTINRDLQLFTDGGEEPPEAPKEPVRPRHRRTAAVG